MEQKFSEGRYLQATPKQHQKYAVRGGADEPSPFWKGRRRRFEASGSSFGYDGSSLLLAGGVAQAIINGQPDTEPNAHPYVGAYVAKEKGIALSVCSGTLISARDFLTPGHCTEIEEKRQTSVRLFRINLLPLNLAPLFREVLQYGRTVISQTPISQLVHFIVTAVTALVFAGVSP